MGTVSPYPFDRNVYSYKNQTVLPEYHAPRFICMILAINIVRITQLSAARFVNTHSIGQPRDPVTAQFLSSCIKSFDSYFHCHVRSSKSVMLLDTTAQLSWWPYRVIDFYVKITFMFAIFGVWSHKSFVKCLTSWFDQPTARLWSCCAGLSAQWVGERPRLQAVEIFIRRSRCMKRLSDGDLPMVSVILVLLFRRAGFILSKYQRDAFTCKLKSDTSAVCWWTDQNGRRARGCHLHFDRHHRRAVVKGSVRDTFKNAVE